MNHLFTNLLKNARRGTTQWVICSDCSGEGRSCAHLGEFTSEDFAADPEFAEDYFDGAYDRACQTCSGLGRVREFIRGTLTFTELRAVAVALRDGAPAWNPWNDPQARAEMRMGA